MVTNIFLICDRCKTKYRLRWQIEDHQAPIMIRCPECNSKITGHLRAGAEEPIVLYNAKRTDDETDVETLGSGTRKILISI